MSAVPAEIAGVGSTALKLRVSPGFDPLKAQVGPDEYFLLSRIDGSQTLREVILSTGLPVDRAVSIVTRLRSIGALLLPGETAAPAPVAAPKPTPPPANPVRAAAAQTPSAPMTPPHGIAIARTATPMTPMGGGKLPARPATPPQGVPVVPAIPSIPSTSTQDPPPAVARTMTPATPMSPSRMPAKPAPPADPPPKRPTAELEPPTIPRATAVDPPTQPKAKRPPAPDAGLDHPTVRRAPSADLSLVLPNASDEERAALAEVGELDADTRVKILAMARLVNTNDPWALLGVQRGADTKVLKRAYFKLSKEVHPDRFFGKNLGSFADRLSVVFEAVSRAYARLTTPEKSKPSGKQAVSAEQPQTRSVR